MRKEVQKSTGSLNLNLYVFQRIRAGKRPSQICQELDMKQSALSYYLSSLKRSGFIKKIGYGVWEILKDFDEKEVQKSTKVTHPQLESNLKFSKPDSVRGHAFQFKIKLPKIRNWDKREKIFESNGLNFTPLILGGLNRGQRIIFKGRKIWITDKSIIIYERASYMADKAQKSRDHAVYDLIKLLEGLGRLLGANFKIRRQYVFKVSRQHYSLIKNALAKQYDREGKKLHIYNSAGLWFVIDNSFNLHEAETVHPITAVSDNEKVLDFFNGVKELENYTPQFVVNSLAQNSQNLGHYAEHLQAHVKSVQELGKGVSELTSVIKKLKEVSK